ncbi:hypothetical protein BDF21DRAFT_451476 [Thamnidium elegans]|nr:hypothetical protein BDF21DRAFT_451476 [Thamnidium elegans]
MLTVLEGDELTIDESLDISRSIFVDGNCFNVINKCKFGYFWWLKNTTIDLYAGRELLNLSIRAICRSVTITKCSDCGKPGHMNKGDYKCSLYVKRSNIKGYSGSLSTACVVLATTYLNHIVENFKGRVLHYLSLELSMIYIYLKVIIQ